MIRTIFDQKASVNSAAKAAEVRHGLARRVLVADGIDCAESAPYGMAEAKKRSLELIAQGQSMREAAAEVGVYYRTAKDWRAGIRRSGKTRIRPDGFVVNYVSGTGYKNPVTKPNREPAQRSVLAICPLQDRLDIADELLTVQTFCGDRSTDRQEQSTVSQDARMHRVGATTCPIERTRRPQQRRRGAMIRTCGSWEGVPSRKVICRQSEF
ncbi:helix-turn-helix domain-containing protein [Rhodococcus sp. NPDC057014]|uniref:helix-turn-helix domain-containing protein n=1 Tax=Rhodococcus sp. NPDC057014 TaxID=3346000 RepID=UPI00362ACE6E